MLLVGEFLFSSLLSEVFWSATLNVYEWLCVGCVMTYRQAVMLVLVRDQQAILIHKPQRPADEWYFPAGGVHENESLREAFFREANEELGLQEEDFVSVVNTQEVQTFSYPSQLQEETGFLGQQRTVFLAALSGSASPQVDNDELDAYKFVSIDDLSGELAFDDLKELVKKLDFSRVTR